MKKIFFAALIIVVTFAGLASAKIEVPGRTRSWVNDYAGIIDKDTKTYLESLVSSIKQKTPEPIEVVVATFRSLEGWDFNDFSKEYGEKWRDAKRGKRDNGVIIIVAIKERRVGIGVGRNLDNILIPGVTDDIIKNIITPEFAQARFSDGIRKAVEKIVTILNETDIPTGNAAAYIRGALLLVIIAALIFLLRNIYSRRQ
ncbi:MAG: TPM domain-containing protein [Candidatus Omnitrophica bacterium]|nr:TPM domain-containing protein [Candidatus Omnitrophota bacterium]